MRLSFWFIPVICTEKLWQARAQAGMPSITHLSLHCHLLPAPLSHHLNHLPGDFTLLYFHHTAGYFHHLPLVSITTCHSHYLPGHFTHLSLPSCTWSLLLPTCSLLSPTGPLYIALHCLQAPELLQGEQLPRECPRATRGTDSHQE